MRQNSFLERRSKSRGNNTSFQVTFYPREIWQLFICSCPSLSTCLHWQKYKPLWDCRALFSNRHQNLKSSCLKKRDSNHLSRDLWFLSLNVRRLAFPVSCQLVLWLTAPSITVRLNLNFPEPPKSWEISWINKCKVYLGHCNRRRQASASAPSLLLSSELFGTGGLCSSLTLQWNWEVIWQRNLLSVLEQKWARTM